VFNRLADLICFARKAPPSHVRWFLLSALLLLTFALKVYFIFVHSNYEGHLVSDMGFYWQRAHDRFHGNYFSPDQWYANPPFFPIFLEQIFKILFFLGLSAYELQTVHILFAVFSTLSALGVFGITAQLTGGFWRAFGAAALYALCYPILYFNAFVLTENLAIPLLILVFWIVIRREESLGWMVTAGILFGCAVAIRVALGPLGFFIFLYLLAARPVSWARFRRACAFSAAFFAIVFLLLVENFFISKGELRGLAGYFGFNVFLQYCQVRNAYSGSSFYNNPTFFSRHPEFGVFHTNHPFNDRAYFLDLVSGCIHNNPHIWIENLKLFKDVFLYPPWPEFTHAGGYLFWMPAFCYVTLFLSLSIGLFYWAAPRQRLWLSRVTLLLSPLFCSLGMCYFFGMEGRLLLPGLFGLYVVFFAVLPYLARQKFKTALYYMGLAALFLTFSLTSALQTAGLQKKLGVETVKKVHYSNALTRYPDGTGGDTWGFFIMPNLKSGVLLEYPEPRKARRFEISTDSFDSYSVEFYLDEKKVGRQVLPFHRTARGGIHKRILSMPPAMDGHEFNRVLVRPLSGDGFYSLASFILDPVEKERMKEVYGVSFLQETTLAKLSKSVPDGSPGDRQGFILMPNTDSGVLIACEGPMEAGRIEIVTDSWDSYQVEFYFKDKKGGKLFLPLHQLPGGGTYKRLLDMPASLIGKKFDSILVRPVQGDGFFSLASIVLDPPQ